MAARHFTSRVSMSVIRRSRSCRWCEIHRGSLLILAVARSAMDWPAISFFTSLALSLNGGPYEKMVSLDCGSGLCRMDRRLVARAARQGNGHQRIWQTAADVRGARAAD